MERYAGWWTKSGMIGLPPQTRDKGVGRRNNFWDSFIIVFSGIPKQDSIFLGRDLNGHVGRDDDGYGGVHGGMHVIWYKKR